MKEKNPITIQRDRRNNYYDDDVGDDDDTRC